MDYDTKLYETLVNVLWLVVVAVLWGGTNPLIKQGGAGIEKVERDSAVQQFLAEIVFLISNWKYMVPFLLNQCGSVLFYLTLSEADLSLAVPLTNSLTFVFTAVVAHIMGEKINAETLGGMCLVVLGVSLCVYSKAS